MIHVANDLIQAHVKGLTFTDVGGLWGTQNERITVAVKAGAKSATMIDEQPMGNEWWQKFHERAAQEGCAGRYESIEANLDDPTLVDRVGQFDFVHCSGIIYHAPSPFHTLTRLRALTKQYLILGTMTVPEAVKTDIGTVDMTDGAAYFIPALHGHKLNIFKKYFTDLQVYVHNVSSKEAYPWMLDVEKPNYAPWWWFWTVETISRMAETAGFETISVHEAWEGRSHMIFMKTCD